MHALSIHDERLSDLWSRRSTLSEAEWRQLYEVVWLVLYHYVPREFAGLPGQRDLYIQDFFVEKVFQSDAAADGQAVHAGGLRHFYRNFLRDKLRSERRHLELFESQAGDDDGCCGAAMDCSDEGAEQAVRLALLEAGKSLDGLRAAADAWLDRMQPWVTVYLGLNYCPDAETSEALVTLADRMRIASYHHKAAQLGFNWSADKRGNNGRPFEGTLLGRFVSQDAGIAITQENQDLLLLTLKILCHQALLRSEQLKDLL